MFLNLTALVVSLLSQFGMPAAENTMLEVRERVVAVLNAAPGRPEFVRLEASPTEPALDADPEVVVEQDPALSTLAEADGESAAPVARISPESVVIEEAPEPVTETILASPVAEPAVAESVVAESVVAESVVAESVVAESVVAESAGTVGTTEPDVIATVWPNLSESTRESILLLIQADLMVQE